MARNGLKSLAGFADQAVASATNVALTVVVAREVDPWTLGAFAVAYTLYLVAVGLSRAVASEPLLVRYSHVPGDAHREGARRSTGVAIVIGVAGGLGMVAVALPAGGAIADAVVPLGLFLPALLLKDAWRFVFLAAGRPGQAIVNDLVWALAQVACVGGVMAADRPQVGWFVAAWGAAALVACVAGAVQAGLAPSPWRAGRWLREHRDLLPSYTVDFAARAGGRNLTLLAVGWVGGLPALAAIRAAEVLFGGLNVVLQAGYLVAIPQAVGAFRRSAAALRAAVFAQSGLLVLLSLGYSAVVLLIPDAWGRALVGQTWSIAEDVLLAQALLYTGIAAITGPVVGLRALGDARRSAVVRLLLVPLYIASSVAGASLAGAAGAVLGLGLAHLAGLILWIAQFRTLLHIPPSPQGTSMELNAYGRRHRGILVPLLLVPLVAAGGGLGWAAIQPATYRHVTELQIPAPSDTASAATAEQSVATFRSLINSPSVVNAVARDTGVDVAVIRAGLTTERPSQDKERGNVVQVVFTGDDRATAPKVTSAAAVTAANELLGPNIERARGNVDGAQAAADERAEAVSDAMATGGLVPDRYRVLLGEITRLKTELIAPSGNRRRGVIARALREREAEQKAIATQVVPFMMLQNRADQANRSLIDAYAKLREVEGRLSQARASIVPLTTEAEAIPKAPVMIRAGAMGAGVGVLLAIVALGLRELLRTGRRDRDEEELLPPAPQQLPERV
ncbi:hypothetical protein Aph01nite_01460 [Acrocarpospora phusangensis]|uniref:Uncharacterized protein n=1 Tax=Acrocarpospora phusangensis TaxID=1070424 RepID=A0A919Q485_9ACTN|nr:hypothetical protein [Acrocarpospora phusangensis]GIH21836.1 hypothetical protein Aph01nite_01460 [Acrocarpospora phusangensis]